jgi:CMP-N-acetylneuraminic acid synthetase
MYKADTITLLQPTSPLRSSSDISEAFKVFNKGYDSVVSVTSMGDKYWLNTSGGFKPFYNPDKRMNRQDPRTNLIYYENGAIYITKRWILEDNKGRIGGKIGFYEMSQERSYQIDSEFDWKVCETVLGENIWK